MATELITILITLNNGEVHSVYLSNNRILSQAKQEFIQSINSNEDIHINTLEDLNKYYQYKLYQQSINYYGHTHR